MKVVFFDEWDTPEQRLKGTMAILRNLVRLAAPAKAAAAETLPRIGNLSFAYMHVGAPERVLEFYEDEIRAGYFQPISTTWFWHPTYAQVRKTARFKNVVRDLGLVEYWEARGWLPQCRPTQANDFTCD